MVFWTAVVVAVAAVVAVDAVVDVVDVIDVPRGQLLFSVKLVVFVATFAAEISLEWNCINNDNLEN